MQRGDEDEDEDEDEEEEDLMEESGTSVLFLPLLTVLRAAGLFGQTGRIFSVPCSI